MAFFTGHDDDISSIQINDPKVELETKCALLIRHGLRLEHKANKIKIALPIVGS